MGFSEEPEAPRFLLRHFFPSKIGGQPAWLDPIRLPDGGSVSSLLRHRSSPSSSFSRSMTPSSDSLSSSLSSSSLLLLSPLSQPDQVLWLWRSSELSAAAVRSDWCKGRVLPSHALRLHLYERGVPEEEFRGDSVTVSAEKEESILWVPPVRGRTGTTGSGAGPKVRAAADGVLGAVGGERARDGRGAS